MAGKINLLSPKIDLLPPYVRMRERFRLLIKTVPILLLLVALALGLAYWQMTNNVRRVNEAYAALADRETKTTAAEAATATATTKAAPLLSAVKFMVDSGKTGPERAVLINIIRNYIYNGADVESIDVTDGKTVKIVARVETPDEYANFLYRLRQGSISNNGVLFAADPKSSAVTVAGVAVPGGNNPTFIRPAPGLEPVPVIYPLTVTAIGLLKDPIVVPSESGSGASTAASGAGAPGMPGMPGGPGMRPAGANTATP